MKIENYGNDWKISCLVEIIVEYSCKITFMISQGGEYGNKHSL